MRWFFENEKAEQLDVRKHMVDCFVKNEDSKNISEKNIALYLKQSDISNAICGDKRINRVLIEECVNRAISKLNETVRLIEEIKKVDNKKANEILTNILTEDNYVISLIVGEKDKVKAYFDGRMDNATMALVLAVF